MARLIDADKLMKNIEDNSYPVSQKHNSIEKGMTLTGIRQCIEEQPTVDAEPVRYGKWIDNNAGNHDPRDRWVKCSLCGYSTTDRFSKEYHYCPNCGSIMRGDDYGKK